MRATGTTRHESETVEGNRVRLDAEKTERIVRALNTDLATVHVLYHQVRKHHWVLVGAEFGPLHEWFDDEADCLEWAADEIAERIRTLGGVPVSDPAAFEERATVDFEGENAYDVRTSLRNDLEMYAKLAESLRDHVEFAENLGDFATGQLLRKLATDVEEDVHELERFLADDTLVVESTVR